MARRLFFSFHYQDVKDFRANVPRKSWVTQKREDAGFFDASIWESSKKTGDEALKRLINNGLENTSATAVLIGTYTYSRPWVKYEIIRSIYKGNYMFGIHINSIPGKDQLTKTFGANPFKYLAIKYSNDGSSVSFLEWSGTAWVAYSAHASWRLSTADQNRRGTTVQLSEWYHVYDWTKDKGYDNLAYWVGA